jgi:hypothetical protein
MVAAFRYHLAGSDLHCGGRSSARDFADRSAHKCFAHRGLCGSVSNVLYVLQGDVIDCGAVGVVDRDYCMITLSES